MAKILSLKSGLFSVSLGIAAAFAAYAPVPAQAGGDKVDCSKLKDISGFCNDVEGKAASIKKVMKDAEKAYKAAGKGDISCKSCHQTGSGGALNKSESDKLWGAYKPYVDSAITQFKAKAAK
jgi:mono/diheme cytochrome c family protein